jgi:hypothetical protein
MLMQLESPISENNIALLGGKEEDDDDDDDHKGNEDDEFNVALQESLACAPSPNLNPADPLVLSSMSRFKFVTPGDTPGVSTCPICMEDIKNGEDVVKTRCCSGMTHHECMENTLCVISTCPFCRRGVVRSSST